MVVSLSRCQDDIIVTHEIHKIMTSTSNILSHTDPLSLTLSWWWELIFWTLNCIFWFWTLRNLLSLTSLVCRKCCYVKSILTFINNCSNKIRNPPGVFDIFQRKNLQIPPPRQSFEEDLLFWNRFLLKHKTRRKVKVSRVKHFSRYKKDF